MSSRYAPLPTSSQQDEMNAAFDDSDDEEHLHDDHPNQDRAPLLPQSQSSNRSPPSHPLADDDYSSSSALDTRRSLAMSAPAPPVPGTYDFEYDYPPPPGSPPPITAYGNSNGYVAEGPVQAAPSRPNILRRALGAVLPTHYVRDDRGGGVGNDGVFANMTAKPVGPSQAIREATNSGVHFAPEEVQKEAPPSYQSAQADAVPAYWETTIVTPSAPGVDGELIVDQLPTGSVFSFLWNLLVSMSFQFVGFLLTYLLHTTHAAKCGSRAGLGVTLIQYGFYLRQRMDLETDQQDSLWGWPNQDGNPAQPHPTFATADDARKYYEGLADKNNTMALDPETIASIQATASTANEWLSFFLMTVGWFVLLTSVLGFWRVKRWERGVRRAAHEAANPRPPPTAEELAQEQEIISSIEAAFGLVNTRVQNGADRIRSGLGLPANWDQAPGEQADAVQARDQDRRRFAELTRR
ncbi:hypothetical protein FRB90_003411 [Tulasnella sp. 427]|nr:hypothetical protein FRB90_003411 [Tulasnella sp. 427]